MILQALNSYYERLEQDRAIGIAPFGFSRQQIAFCVTLNADGSLHAIDDIRERNGKKAVPRSLVVLGNAKPSGSGINPGFLWDNPAYMLGYKSDDMKPERTRDSFVAFRKRHLDAEAAIDDPEFSAVCRFLEKWNPAEAERHPSLVEISTGFGVFRIRAADHYVHEQKSVRQWWQQQLTDAEADADSTIGQCLVTGEVGPLARLHEPKIKGVWGAQSSGAAIVSFNLDAFESYGKEQSLNSPVSEQAAFQYCTALNHLLRSNSPQRVQIGDASTVFWTERPTAAENLLPWVFEPNKDTENEALKNRIQTVLRSIASGSYPGEFGNPGTPFYVLGLSPNAARLSVRFWWVSNLGELIEKIFQHFDDLRIEHSKERDPEFLAVWQLLRETARDSKDIPPLLSGAIMRAVVTGCAYPEALYGSVLRRIHADRQLDYSRAAIVKAHLNRRNRLGIRQLGKKLYVSLDSSQPNASYHIGRLFAVLEQLQKDSLPAATGIRDRYFGTAMASPALVFPHILNNSHHHLAKLTRSKELAIDDVSGRRHRYVSLITDICHRIEEFPPFHDQTEQGLFAVGYYHEQRWLYTPGELKSDHS